MFNLLRTLLAWSLGLRLDSGSSSTGLGGEQLLPRRADTLLERLLKVACTGLFFAAGYASFGGNVGGLFGTESYYSTIPACAWIIFMLYRRDLAMDGGAIGIGLWTFAPYIALNLLGAFDLVPLHALLAQAVAVGAVISYGLYRDISKEMKPGQ